MEENNIQPQEQQEVSQHEDARIVVLREEDIKRLINAIDELKKITDFLR